jgi:glycosyltransferase involved in cell wall biosynthesis
MKPRVLGIDASNIRVGGGITHLRSLLESISPEDLKFERVVLWAGTSTLSAIANRSWLIKEPIKALDKSWLHRNLWQRFSLKRQALKDQCDILFVPGGSAFSSFRPLVCMNQNLLPFMLSELKRYGFSLMSLRLLLLNRAQRKTFKKSSGVIFLSQHAKRVVNQSVGEIKAPSVTIPHGNNSHYKKIDKSYLPISQYSVTRPFRILYVSIIDVYKHHFELMQAIKLLREEGYPVALDLIGACYKGMTKSFAKLRKELDPEDQFISYHGAVDHKKLTQYYRAADLGVWASSCETFGLILTEMMSCSLPIAASKGGPNDEILGEAGLYFNPEDPESIARSIKKYLDSETLRSEKSKQAFQKSQHHSWQACAKETFSFLEKVLKDNRTSVANR